MSRLSLPAPEPSRANTGRSRARSKAPSGRPNKRIILCEDGTWLNSDSGDLEGSIAIPSNVTRISRCIKPMSNDGVPQIVYYHHGVGGGSGPLSRLQGFTGDGISEIIREGYQFVATNWTPGDEIFIFGFSRGAYTARSIAGLIDNIGILTNAGLPYLAEIFRDTKHQHDRDYQPKYPDIPFKNKPSANDPEYLDELVRLRLTTPDVPIKVVGVWDTVGSLGVPKIGWLTRLGLQSTQMKEMSFYDTALGNCIEYAFQALALDERRFSFQPALWEKFEGNTTALRQVWFPGAHSNIGGGYEDQQIATISLAWMVAHCQPFLDFDEDYIFEEWEKVEDFYEKHEQKIRPWSFGYIYDGITSLYALGGINIRKPGRYCATDPTNGKETDDPLIDTWEYIHPSVRSRLKLGGPGVDGRGRYECKSLQDWKLVIENEEGRSRPRISWRSRDKPKEPGFVRELRESPLLRLETELLEYDSETAEYVLRPSGMRKRRGPRSTGGRSAQGGRSRSRRPDD
ncbi:uncharacterized protein LTR77_005825 [Saxophila tyrrhenica]|uniref:T6SS Phospholipase effector Tle1-like catalytic domain-containing protein n=1 Tax=Saxophila tyrrhenica TaxID=1690608 RepID=A0AAV9PDM0_9PEZI|nr:hypothetical protein LTR77_005825 [Saxophila tyrrhenica]